MTAFSPQVTYAMIVLARERGLSFTQIGKSLGISRQRAQQIYSKNTIPQEKQSSTIKTQKQRNQEVRLEVLAAYGNCCACCGETNSYFLGLDHSNGDGATHRQKVTNIYWFLRRNNYPRNLGLVVLCWNCHLSKDFYGMCPHKGTPDPNFIRSSSKRDIGHPSHD